MKQYIVSIVALNILTLNESLMLDFYKFFISLAANQASALRILKSFSELCIHDPRYLKLSTILISLLSMVCICWLLSIPKYMASVFLQFIFRPVFPHSSYAL